MGLFNLQSTFFKIIFPFLFIGLICCSEAAKSNIDGSKKEPFKAQVSGENLIDTVRTGSEVLIGEKIHLLKGKRIALLANHTSLLSDGTHLLDTLLSLGVNVKKVFSPEHGFRGNQDAGKKIASKSDPVTGLPIISLYGKRKKPFPEDLENIDLVLFDIQDVGARFYTYISTLTYMMEACAEGNVSIMVLDRPNPNGSYVQGPVLDLTYKSFVGMHQIPVVHGMTVGEYARMVNGENWMETDKKCNLSVISCQSYSHDQSWDETGLKWVSPSPNLPTVKSAVLYPILCWYEAMPVSIGRGTETPFEVLGAPWHLGYENAIKRDSIKRLELPGILDLYGLQGEHYSFTPVSMPGKSTHPKFENQKCFGVKFINQIDGDNLWLAGLSLLKNVYDEAVERGQDEIFSSFFYKLSGSKSLEACLIKGLSPEEILLSWKDEVNAFKRIRSKYLLY